MSANQQQHETLATSLQWKWIIVFLLHMPMAVIFKEIPALSALHALLTGAVAIYFAATKNRSRMLTACAYIIGFEVIWRMTFAPVPWEYAKFIVFLVLLIYAMQTKLEIYMPAVLYVGLLIPSSLLTLMELPLEPARQEITFNLMPPLLLSLCVIVMRNMEISWLEMRSLFLALMAPVFGLSFLIYRRIAVAENLQFSTQSNFVTSGGFGPNQVASAFALAALFAFLLILTGLLRKALPLKLLMFAAVVIFSAQSALTFSRGGILMTVVAVAIAVAVLAKERLAEIVVAAVLLAGIGGFVVAPQLDDFTGGMLSKRMTDTESSSRFELIEADLEIWKSSPILGVGPGMAKFNRGLASVFNSHTEYSRMLAEHGLFGFIALLLLFYLGLASAQQSQAGQQRALALAVLSWSFLFLFINGMRLAMPCFLIGLSFAKMSSARRFVMVRRVIPGEQAGGKVQERSGAELQPSFRGAQS